MMNRINNLPEEMVRHILSFLSTKEAARTSVLSKRWRNLFAFSPNLCFENEYEENAYRNLSFKDFVDRVLATSHDYSPVNKFTLKCRHGDLSAHINRWIRNVLNRGVMDLAICVTGRYGQLRPYGQLRRARCRLEMIFTCKTLVKLRLGTRFEIAMVPENASLPSLKSLFLDQVLFSSHEDKGCGFEALLSACPVLEELDLAHVRWTKVDVKVSSASLKSLTLDQIKHVGTLSFDTPSLVYFYFSAFVPQDFPVFKMENLLEVRLRLLRVPIRVLNEADLYKNLMKLINGIQNVEHLNMSPNILELSLRCESIPVFNNLKSLAIRSENFGGWEAIPVLLRNCPNIETLVIEGSHIYHAADKCGDACKLHFSGEQMSFTHILSSKDGTDDSMVLCNHERDENVKACLGLSSVQCQLPSD